MIGKVGRPLHRIAAARAERRQAPRSDAKQARKQEARAEESLGLRHILGGFVAASVFAGTVAAADLPQPLPHKMLQIDKACRPADGLTFVCGLKQPEDIDVLSGSDWVVVSSSSFKLGNIAPGRLFFVNAKSHALFQFANIPVDATPRPPYAECPSAPPVLSPHGIAIRPGTDGKSLLYVVNHGREAIELFEIQSRGGQAPTATWVGCVLIPKPVYLNAVAPTPDGGFVATNMGDVNGPPLWMAMFRGKPTGRIYRWTPGGKPTVVSNSQGSGNNGIAVGADGTIYMSSWGGRAIIRLTPEGGGYRRDEVRLNFLPDNMKWTADGRITVGGQRISAFSGCGADVCQVAGTIAVLDPKTLSVTVIYETDGSSFSNLTTGLPVGDDLWLGSVDEYKVAILAGANPVRKAFAGR